MNRLVPYLDLFSRLSDEELARLARTPLSAPETLRLQVDEVNRALDRYTDLLPRLSDDELARLTGATVKTIRFWRLSQPRHLQGDTRRRGNADTTSAPSGQQENVPEPRTSEDSDLTSIGPSSSRRRAEFSPEPPSVEEDPDAAESSTFVIDTIE